MRPAGKGRGFQQQEATLLRCPACEQKCFRLMVLHRHILTCCPDLLPVGEWEQSVPDGIDRLLKSMREKEKTLYEPVLDIVYRQIDEQGDPIRQGPQEVAAALSVSMNRAERLLQAAKKSIPLVGDPIPVDVLYEDEDFIAVDKPTGVISAPKHRFTGGSMVNRIIGTCGFEPRVLHRLDMNTTGVILFAKNRDVVPHVHMQFR
jgi:23S rRNA-/tRNA-specific pseudouridylate synthase